MTSRGLSGRCPSARGEKSGGHHPCIDMERSYPLGLPYETFSEDTAPSAGPARPLSAPRLMQLPLGWSQLSPRTPVTRGLCPASSFAGLGGQIGTRPGRGRVRALRHAVAGLHAAGQMYSLFSTPGRCASGFAGNGVTEQQAAANLERRVPAVGCMASFHRQRMATKRELNVAGCHR